MARRRFKARARAASKGILWMIVVHTRRSFAWAPRALWLGLAAVLAACHGDNISPPGTPVMTMKNTSAEFASYIVSIDSITLTSSTETVDPLTTPEVVDLAHVTDIGELISAGALPNDTYTSATITLDYTAASVWVYVDGHAVLATLVGANGTTPTTSTVTITFDPAHPLVVVQGQSVRMNINVDLVASNAINTTAATPVVEILPFAVISPAPLDGTVLRSRGLFVALQGSNQFIMNARPFVDEISELGAIFVNVDAQTYYNINGVTFIGAPGLTALSQTLENTPLAAFGTLSSLSGITPSFNASAIYAGSSLESPIEDYVTGTVNERIGDTINLANATLVSRLGVITYAADVAVGLSAQTIVSEDGVNAANLSTQSISIGQLVNVSGQGGVNSVGGDVLDATAGQVRLNLTPLWGTLTSATPSSATLDMLTLGDAPPNALLFTGTGSSTGADANPAAYIVSTGSADQSATAPGTLLQFNGFVTPFGSAPPDFTALQATPGTATPQILVIEWESPGPTNPFSSNTAAGLVVNFSEPTLSTTHYIQTGPATMVLQTLPTNPPFTITTVGADQSDLELTVGSAQLETGTTLTGVSLFNSAAAFSAGLTAKFNGTNRVFRLVAVGQYNASSNTFVTSSIDVALFE
jgi:hypothetical protein